MNHRKALKLALIVGVMSCPGQLWGACPTQNDRAFQQNSTVDYSLGNISGTEGTQLQAAISDWNMADSGSNHSGVTFCLSGFMQCWPIDFNSGGAAPADPPTIILQTHDRAMTNRSRSRF